jgi:hypothetical protein
VICIFRMIVYSFLYLLGFIPYSREWNTINYVYEMLPFHIHTISKSNWYENLGFTIMVVHGRHVHENSRGTFVLFKLMKWEDKSSNSKIVLNDMRIEMIIIMRITLKLVLLAIIRRMLNLSTTDHIMMLLTILLLSIKERIKYLYKILMWELVLLNLRGKCNLIISLTKRIFYFKEYPDDKCRDVHDVEW